MLGRLTALFDPKLRRQRPVAQAVVNYMAGHRGRVMRRTWQEHLAREVVAKRQGADLSLPDLEVGSDYIDFATVVMLTALDGFAEMIGMVSSAGEKDIVRKVGWARGMLEQLFGLAPDEAFNAVGAAVLRQPEVDPPEGQSPEDHVATLDDVERKRLRLAALAESVGLRIAEGVARGEDRFEPTDEEVEEVFASIEVSIAAPIPDGEA